jgi:hypothetical protein
MKTHCKKLVHDSFGFGHHECTRWAVKDGFCKQHHPDTVKEGDKARHAEWEENRKKEPWYVLAEVKEELAEMKKWRKVSEEEPPCDIELLVAIFSKHACVAWWAGDWKQWCYPGSRDKYILSVPHSETFWMRIPPLEVKTDGR